MNDDGVWSWTTFAAGIVTVTTDKRHHRNACRMKQLHSLSCEGQPGYLVKHNGHVQG
jgi:hypothetical protein